jgi:light-regulated signal transduction histidine kinase (bacteriophytochrome)/CheY-like chemotaxis protein
MDDRPHDSATDELPVDLTTCDREPIHIIGRIQSFGYLLACSSDWTIGYASRNCGDLLGRDADELIGSSVAQWLTEGALHDIRSRLQLLSTPDSVERIFELDVTGDGRMFDVAVHRSGSCFVFEFEPSELGKRRDYISNVRTMVARMRKAQSVQQLCDMAVRQLRALTGFDRVMIYRFEPNGAGEVIAASVQAGVDSYLGQHFPASDIPQQARALYARNILRIIGDVEDPTVEIVRRGDGEPLDLSMSGLRAVSPIHIEYLGNMGVGASMSVSIMRRGKLWGLMACHHYAPLHLSYSLRTSAELFGELFAYELDQTESESALQQRENSELLHDRMMARLAGGGSLLSAFEESADEIATVIPFDGIVGWVGGQFMSRGQTPTREHFIDLVGFLDTKTGGAVWATDYLRAFHPLTHDFSHCCAGMLSLPVSRQPGDYIVLFRDEFVHSVEWAGNPQKPVESGPLGTRLTPRKSFEIWKEERRGYSRPWQPDEIASAESLRITLLEVVLRLADSAHHEREMANKRQETLIAELNHRIRNMLNLIRGLIAQSRSSSQSVDEFAAVLGSRIYALARAHDQVTNTNWTPSSLQNLILTECRAYADGDASRVFFDGIDALVAVGAFTPLALVFHELTTNSCKYGALGDPAGNVSVKMRRQADGALAVEWQERGGPPVSAPARRGFGSTIIERTIPHELGGAAEVEFRPNGLYASFVIPAEHIVFFDNQRPAEDASPAHSPSHLYIQSQFAGEVLIVEDNIIIAMEAESLLGELGLARCHVAGSVKRALQLIEDHEVGFAVLDIDLGSETSEQVAMALRASGTPFIFASGYGEGAAFDTGFADVPVVTKPYSAHDIATAIARLASAGEP